MLSTHTRKTLFYWLNATGTISQKDALVESFTDHRTDSIKEMEEEEAMQLIDHIRTKFPKLDYDELKEAATKSLIGVTYGLHRVAPQLDLVREDGKINRPRLDEILKKKIKNRTIETMTVEQLKDCGKYIRAIRRGYLGGGTPATDPNNTLSSDPSNNY